MKGQAVAEDKRPPRPGVVPRIIISYDISKTMPSKSSMVHQFVHGFKKTVKLKRGRMTYAYPGLVDRHCVVKLGQSVLMMKEDDAEEFILLLDRLRVHFRATAVWADSRDLLQK